MQALIEAKVDVNAADARGQLAVHSAARNGHVEVLELLLGSAPESPAKPDGHGMRVLHHAIGHPKCVALLLEKSPTARTHIDDQDRHGLTPLHRAISMNKVQDAIALIRAGASLEVRDSTGKTALELPHSESEGLSEAVSARARAGNRQQYEEAVKLFNEKPKRALEFLVEQRLVREGPEGALDIAQFLNGAQGLDLQQLGEFLSDPGPLVCVLCMCFL